VVGMGVGNKAAQTDSNDRGSAATRLWSKNPALLKQTVGRRSGTKRGKLLQKLRSARQQNVTFHQGNQAKTIMKNRGTKVKRRSRSNRKEISSQVRTRKAMAEKEGASLISGIAGGGDGL